MHLLRLDILCNYNKYIYIFVHTIYIHTYIYTYIYIHIYIYPYVCTRLPRMPTWIAKMGDPGGVKGRPVPLSATRILPRAPGMHQPQADHF